MEPSTRSEARKFEEDVASLYKYLGATVQMEVAIGGQRLDMLASFERPNLSTTLAVECKYYSQLVGASSMNAFSAVVSRLRDQGVVDGGVLVTNTGFTKVALGIAKEFRIQALHIDQLRAMARGAAPYLFIEAHEGKLEYQVGDKKSYIFVVMPFAPEFDDVYALGIGQIADKLGFMAERADDIEHNIGILEVIQQKIRECDVVVADITGINPNVLYEIGYAHAVPREVILIQRSGTPQPPFDIRGQNCIFYPNIVHLRERLERRLKAMFGPE
jgi:hypothetical protein